MAEYVDREAIREKACKGCTMRDGASGCWNADPCETLVIEFVSAYAADVVPVSDLLTLRDRLYEHDAITMEGLAQLNELIARCKKDE